MGLKIQTIDNVINMNIFRGDDDDFTLKFKDANAVAINITGWTIKFSVRKAPATTTTNTDTTANGAIIHKIITSHSNAVGGETLLSLLQSDTNIDAGAYLFDIQALRGGKKTTISKGKFIIDSDITRS